MGAPESAPDTWAAKELEGEGEALANGGANDPSARSLPPKLYFRIGEVAELVGVEPHVLRYWEREFRSIRPTKSAKGQRVYSRRDVESLMRVRELLYQEGFTIAGAKKKLASRAAAQKRPQSACTPVEPDGAVEAQKASAPQPESAPDAWESSPKELPARAHLLVIRDEIEAFLAELEGDPA